MTYVYGKLVIQIQEEVPLKYDDSGIDIMTMASGEY